MSGRGVPRSNGNEPAGTVPDCACKGWVPRPRVAKSAKEVA